MATPYSACEAFQARHDGMLAKLRQHLSTGHGAATYTEIEKAIGMKPSQIHQVQYRALKSLVLAVWYGEVDPASLKVDAPLRRFSKTL